MLPCEKDDAPIKNIFLVVKTTRFLVSREIELPGMMADGYETLGLKFGLAAISKLSWAGTFFSSLCLEFIYMFCLSKTLQILLFASTILLVPSASLNTNKKVV